MPLGRNDRIRGARGWLGTLLVAWTFVSGSALLLATAHYQRSGDISILVVWLLPAFLIGCVLFGAIAIVAVFGAGRSAEVEVVPQRGTRQSIFRK